ncbi:MAG: hypothetical protein M1387_06505 [Thaumarchaeota archaeon]|nr:hypothetical protein [Nitrososphaerota archaeon]
MKIFREAATGFRGCKESERKMGLTKKQYYTALLALEKCGLVTRKDGVYRHTSFGALVLNNHVKPLEEALIRYWHFFAIDELKVSRSIPEQELGKIVEVILSDTKLRKPSIDNDDENGNSNSNSSGGGCLPSVAKTINTYDEMIQDTIRLIESAKYEIFIASRYFDANVSRGLLDKIEEGIINLNILNEAANPLLDPSSSRKLQQLPGLIQPESKPNDNPEAAQRSSIEATTPEVSKVRIKNTSKVEYSFVVVDREYCCIEILEPKNRREFNLAIEMSDPNLSQKMIEVFEKLWNSKEEITSI